MKWRIPLADLKLSTEEKNAVSDVLQSNWVTMGSVTERFEKAFSERLGGGYAVAVTNGTAALHLACLSAEIGPGDEVICPALTFVASANAILYCGAVPVFADIKGQRDLTISPEEIEKRLTRRTKAILVVHYGGVPCDMEAIREIAKSRNIAIIEDAAHALGATLEGVPCGRLGTVGCFSFFGNKNITTGEGGMVVTQLKRIARKLRLLRSHGMTSLSWDRFRGRPAEYDVREFGFNYRIDEIRSAMGICQLRKLSGFIRERKRLTQRYQGRLTGIRNVALPFENTRGTSAYHIFPVLLKTRGVRKRLKQVLKEQGIQTSTHYPPVHLFTAYRRRFRYHPGTLPVTEDVSSRELSLPLYPGLGEKKVDQIVSIIQRAL